MFASSFRCDHRRKDLLTIGKSVYRLSRQGWTTYRFIRSLFIFRRGRVTFPFQHCITFSNGKEEQNGNNKQQQEQPKAVKMPIFALAIHLEKLATESALRSFRTDLFPAKGTLSVFLVHFNPPSDCVFAR